MIHVLIFVACLGMDCKVETLKTEMRSKYGCMLLAPTVLVQWEKRHPGWYVEEYTCMPMKLRPR